MSGNNKKPETFPGINWKYSYKTSQTGPGEKPVDILHDFYIPVLRCSVRYDRVAGYFRSTSLAAASQGFSSFTTTGGKMRMVVGADMDQEDVAAILAGDTERMAGKLNERLGKPENWPESVAHGVQLLAWMVANGHLEVRVAFRIHGESGAALDFSDIADGYVHEKWAVFTDDEANRLYITGSLNESRQALVLNAENIDVHADWWNDIERKRADAAEAAFENIWNNQNPHLVVMTLPEAVKKKLLKISKNLAASVEIDGSTALPPRVAPPSAFERLQFALIKDGPKLPYGRYVGMETVPIEPWPHQEVVARRLIETWPYSYLLCDEVGLGKTIEAGLAIRSLYLSGLAKRVLIAPPANLTKQWHREMASKFFLPFARVLTGASVRHEYIFPLDEERPETGIYKPDLCIVSTGLLARKERLSDLQSADAFDIALVDEAHYARRKNPRNGARAHPRFGRLYNVIRDHLRKRSASLWMATATPMQLDWIEVFDLLQLTNRVGPFQFDPSLTWAYYETLGSLARGQNIDKSRWEFLRQSIDSLKKHDPFLNSYLSNAVIDGRIRVTTRQWLQNERIPIGIDRKNIQRLIFSASPLSRVMLRHTRPLLELYKEKGKLSANLAKREILPVPKIVMNAQEKRAYNELEDYCRELSAQISSHSDDSGWRSSLGFFLSFLRLRFASSLYAIRETVRRRREKVIAALSQIGETPEPESDIDILAIAVEEDDEVDEEAIRAFLKNRTPEDLAWEQDRLADMSLALEDLSDTPSKMSKLLSALEDRRIHGGRVQQTVIFTRFYDTLQDIVKRLRQIDQSMLIGTYSGKGGQFVDPQHKKFVGIEREEIKHRFLRGEIDVLVCTDAAAEGLNLQTADLLINYDLPWNPMKVEQRIGRIDRIGQKHSRIFVLNLCYADSAEQIVYDRLLQRLMQAGHVVGLQQFSLLPISHEEFGELAAGKLSPEKLETIAKERIALQRQRTESMEIPARDLYEIYSRLSDGQSKRAAPVTLDSIWKTLSDSKYLRDKGCAVLADTSDKLMILRGLETIPDNTVLTIDRVLYEQGLSDMEGRLHFASYGDPIFDAVLEEFENFELPECIARITEKVPDTHAEVIAYGVACINDEGLPDVRLVKSWRDLQGIQLDETTQLQGKNLSIIKNMLHDIVRDEFDPTRAVQRLEKDNRKAGKSQLFFDLLVMQSLLKPIDLPDDDNFWSFVKDHLDVLINERQKLLIPDLPVEPLKKLKNELLFSLQLPQVEQTAMITLPITYVKAAVDAGCRVAEKKRVKRSDQSIGMVRSSIKRELNF